MLEIKPIESLEQLSQLKAQYFVLSTSALDGMWHFGFVPMANHFGFYEQSLLVGYCCINSDGYMLQFYLSPKAEAQAKELFTLIAQDNSPVIGTLKGAFVSTAEPAYLSLCLDNSSAFEVNALMYQLAGSAASSIKKDQPSKIAMTLADQSQLSDFVEFAVASIGAPEQWLNGYYGNLIQRQELLGYWQDGKLLASGECRLFDEHQTGYADLGMIVAELERGKGIATQVLLYLIDKAGKQGLTAMCSTETSNLGAQKAINRAGMISSHRIVQFEFV